MKGNKRQISIFAMALIAAVLIGAFSLRGGDDRETLTLDSFQAEIEDGTVATAELKELSHEVIGELTDGTRYRVGYVGEFADELTVALTDAEPTVEVSVDAQRTPLWKSLLFTMLPIVVLIGAFIFLISYMQGSGSKAMQFGRARTKRLSKDEPVVTFDDVAGAEEAVEELKEIRDFLSDPSRFVAIGATIPKGVLLLGPPGTGKTLLARAVAGEAGVPFFSMSGSDFVEMFVGVGASRVRNLFKQAKEDAPSIIFVDEIDAVGRHRGAGLGGGHDEREQTLNQMLVEMDGFAANSGVIMIAATNRPDILDPALLRPGRFDRHIVVDKPDLEGRRKILDVHSRSKPLAADVDLDVIAKRTPGFTGADIQNLLNEAALLAARSRRDHITGADIEASIDRVLAGPERRSRLLSDADKKVIAYHEAGHALVGHVLPNTDPVHKVTIIPRGQALGWTLSLPEVETYLRSRSELRDQLAMLLGGRTAEEIMFGDPTTGAANDIEMATDIARSMVTQFGMSDRLGLRKFGKQDGEVFLGKDVNHEADYSNEVAAKIDAEVQALIDAAHASANEILNAHRSTLDSLADALIERETLEREDLATIFADIDTDTSSSATKPLAETVGVRAVDIENDSSDAIPPYQGKV